MIQDDPTRPNPDSILSKIKSQEEKKARLKIFFGMSAGVGKTYAMLKEARLLRERGEDVIIGWLESHGRKETEALADGIESIPRQPVEYRGMMLEEMATDAIIARKPAVVIVDELAHTNAPGLRHQKRYMDVMDLIDAGIDVYTTVNIQHIESMSDVVEEFTGARVRERIPDSVFDVADEVQLVDIPPEELLERLAEGKVYTSDKSSEAVANFFRMERLAMLRELVLKHAAQIASHKLANILKGESPSISSSDSQQLLVAAGVSPSSAYIIRWARRLAYALKAKWTCLYIETGTSLTDTDRENLTRNITLAQNLGATVVTLAGSDVVRTIIDYADQNGASTVIVGKSGIEKTGHFFRRRNRLSERFIRESGRISVIAVQEKEEQETVRRKIGKKIEKAPSWQYGAVFAAVAVVTILNLIITPFSGYLSASILYLAAIILLSLVLDRIPIFVTALFFALAWDFLFIPPKYTFIIGKVEDLLMLLLFFLLATTTGWMTFKLKKNERMLKLREQRMSLLTELAATLESATSAEKTALAGLEYMIRAFHAEVVVFLRNEEGDGLMDSPVNAAIYIKDDKEKAAAHYCYKSGLAAGRFTATFPDSIYHYVPMAAPGGTIGAIGLKLDAIKSWSLDQESFLLTLASTISLAVQREILYERNRKNLLLRESDRLSRILLHSISHELRTPLTVIQGNASALLDPDTAEDKVARDTLIEDIIRGTERLNDIVESLLSMNRLESGKLRLNIARVDPAELLSLAIAREKHELGAREIAIYKPENLPLVECDMVLVIQVIVNLLRNAARYSHADSKIDADMTFDEDSVSFSIADSGPGVNDNDLPHLFEKFFRGENAASRGTGLGLSICKGIVEAHGGTIRAKNLRPGFEVIFTIPIEYRMIEEVIT
jgi:two-component system sensor histidine kinase KdpD